MSMAKEFREFAVKGNVMDLAVGVIIGAAFGKIVDSLVKDIVMPVIGRLVGGLDFTNYFIVLAKRTGAVGVRGHAALRTRARSLIRWVNETLNTREMICRSAIVGC